MSLKVPRTFKSFMCGISIIISCILFSKLNKIETVYFRNAVRNATKKQVFFYFIFFFFLQKCKASKFEYFHAENGRFRFEICILILQKRLLANEIKMSYSYIYCALSATSKSNFEPSFDFIKFSKNI